MAEIKNFYITDGNTARQVVQPLPSRQEIEEEKRRKREDQRRKNRKRHAAIMRRKRMYSVYMITMIVVVGTLFVGYVDLANSITTNSNRVAALETQISDLKSENSTLQSRIDASVNLSEIKDRAVNDLGMVYADSSQIVYYDMEDSDYMSQYSDLP